MGYYVRILGTADPEISVNEISEGLTSMGLEANLTIDESEDPDSWTMMWISNANNEEFLEIERNPVVEGH